MDMSYIALAKQLVGDYWPHVSSVVIPAVATAVFTYIRRPKSTARDTGPYFTQAELLTPPLVRPAYSDRMAYVLAEMSDLAYYQFEGQSGLIEDAVQTALEWNLTDGQDIRQFLDRFSTELMSGRRLSLGAFKRVLEHSGFSLVDVIDVSETQGFVCKRNVAGEPAYLVLAFRGTEKKISDWLTDARCVPIVEGKTRVHTGFVEAFTKNADAEGRTVEERVSQILERPEARDEHGAPLPLFITGHSLGGALALLATRLIAPDVNGACYTFGAPRIGNYEYFRSIKTPVYRVVNSSDVVPRVPPGAVMLALAHVIKMTSWLTGFVPVVSALFDRIEALLDKLNGYRHYGDLRHLSDIAEGRFDTVRLLSNPPAIDRVMWMWRHMATSVLVPVKSHGMSIYRKKLAHIANDRSRVRGGQESGSYRTADC